MDFSPVTKYVINRRLYNQRDFGQKYVKAYAYDPRNGETLLNGVEMTEKNSEGDFYYDWTLPDDIYGDGRQIVIWSVVYSDSLYASRDLNYGDEQHEIRVINNIGRRSGGFINYSRNGKDVDYDKIKKIVGKEVKKRLERANVLKDTNIISEIKALQTSISALVGDAILEVISKIPKPIDHSDNFKEHSKEISNINKEVLDVKGKISKIVIPDYQQVLNSIVSALIDTKKDLVKNILELKIPKISINNVDIPDGEKTKKEIENTITNEFRKDRKFREGVENTIFEINEKL